jgi:5-methylcytosine-specific restriction endonuclease McrA
MQPKTKSAAIALGLKRYFPGSQCKNGHIDERELSGTCVSCRKLITSKYQKSNPDKARDSERKWKRNNMDKVRAKARRWANRNLDKLRLNNANRRARLLRCEGSHTGDDVERLFTLQRGKCAACNKSIVDSYHVDHITPLSKGGSNWPFNLQLLCAFCNVSKHAQDPIHWQQKRGYLL